MDADVSRYFFGVKEDVSSDWKDLAFHLDIGDTRNIASRNRDDKSCCMDMLQTWKRLNGDQATAEALVHALIAANLQSAANNLRRKLGEDPTPITVHSEHHVEVPQVRENAARSENGSFSCKILKCLDISCVFCNNTVWFGFLYTFCFLVKPEVVMIITIASLAIYVIQLILKSIVKVRREKPQANNAEIRPRAGRQDQAGQGDEEHGQVHTIEGRVSLEPSEVLVMTGNSPRQRNGQATMRHRNDDRRKSGNTWATPCKELVPLDGIALKERIMDCTGYRHCVILRERQGVVWQDLWGRVRHGQWYAAGRFRSVLQSTVFYGTCSGSDGGPTLQGLEGEEPEFAIQKSLSGVWAGKLFKKLNQMTKTDTTKGHARPAVECVATNPSQDMEGLVSLRQRPSHGIPANKPPTVLIAHLQEENTALKNQIRNLCRLGVCSATDLEIDKAGTSPRPRMSQENRDSLMECCPTLLQDIYPTFLFPQLVQDGVLDWDEVESIERAGRGTRLDQAKDLIRVLHTKDDKAFFSLCKSLRENEQDFLADMLEGLPSEGTMTKEHREQLTSHCCLFINELQVCGFINDYLIEHGVFNDAIVNEINTARTTRHKIRKLLTILQSRGDRAFKAFHLALQESGEHFLVDRLFD
ncbi:uncharacterized protein LOC144917599 [Branchiostoma floridae x Branchiostoma belcheri]